MKSPWQPALVLKSDRTVEAGSDAALAKAIHNGADLRIYTEFLNNEHVDPKSDSAERIRECADFRCTYLLEDRWTAGIMTLRQPVSLPDHFGSRSSMSFFMYNQDGNQSIARPYLDGGEITGKLGPSPVEPYPEMPKYHQFDNWDVGTNAPSHNFIYDFEMFRYLVRDDWQEIFANDAKGNTVSGSVEKLGDAFREGLEVKVGIHGLCDDLDEHPSQAIPHEVFIQTGSCYYYTEQKLFVAGAHPVVRVRPGIPMKYTSRNWDFGWLLPRSDGLVSQLLYNPYTLESRRETKHHAIRWFVR